MNDIDFTKIFNEAVANTKTVELGFRLYYDKETGKPLFYTSEEHEGDYLIVDKQTYAEGRYDILIRNEQIYKIENVQRWTKLVPSNAGTPCDPDNVMIVDEKSSYKWDVKTYYED